MNLTTNSRRRGRWSIGELARLRDLYGMRSDGAIARDLGRPVLSVRRMADRIFRGPRRVGPWTAEEIQALKRYIGISSPKLIAKVLRRSELEVLSKISALDHISRSGPWSREEVLTLKQYYGSRSDEDLARILGRSEPVVARKAAVLRLSKDKVFLLHVSGQPSQMPRWSAQEEEKLRKLYSTCPNLDIARILGRSVKSIVSKANDLQLKKSLARLENMGRENVALRSDR